MLQIQISNAFDIKLKLPQNLCTNLIFLCPNQPTPNFFICNLISPIYVQL